MTNERVPALVASGNPFVIVIGPLLILALLIATVVLILLLIACGVVFVLLLRTPRTK
jgi:hypothetical protein